MTHDQTYKQNNLHFSTFAFLRVQQRKHAKVYYCKPAPFQFMVCQGPGILNFLAHNDSCTAVKEKLYDLKWY